MEGRRLYPTRRSSMENNNTTPPSSTAAFNSVRRVGFEFESNKKISSVENGHCHNNSVNENESGANTADKKEINPNLNGNGDKDNSNSTIFERYEEEIRTLKAKLAQMTDERDFLLCKVHQLRTKIFASELGHLELDSSSNSIVVDADVGVDEVVMRNECTEMNCPGEDEDEADEDVNKNQIGPLFTVDDHVKSTYSSSEMTRLSSSSSSSSSASSSPVLFNTSSQTSQSSQFHVQNDLLQNEEETADNCDEKNLGGPPARNAALVIQRAFRRYSMVKEFHRIKNERRLSRRITNPVVSVPNGPVINGCNGAIIPPSGSVDISQVEVVMVDQGDNQSPPHPFRHNYPACISSHSHNCSSGISLNRSQSNSSSSTGGSYPNGQQQQQHHLHGNAHLKHTCSDSSNSSRNFHLNNNGHSHPHAHIRIPALHHQNQINNHQHPNPHPQRQGGHPQIKNSSSVSISSNESADSPSSLNNSHLHHMSQQQQQIYLIQQNSMSEAECEIIRKRLYRVGLNLFNKKPDSGINYLVKKKYIEGNPASVARFLISRKGLSKEKIGEYLTNLHNPFSMACLEHFANEIDLNSMPVDVALRRFQTFLRMPGEAQKIERVMESFSRRYASANPNITSQFRNGADTVFVLAFAIIMLNTDRHTPHIKQDKRMKLEDFIKNLRGIDDGADIDREILVGIFERIKESEFKTGSDHVTQVMKVQQTIIGKKPNLAVPHRRLVCYCRLYEVSDMNKKDKIGSHQREVFLFNDTLVLTKIFQKKRTSVTYSFRQSYPLVGISLAVFSNQHYEFGLSLRRGDSVLINLNARNEHDRAKFAEDLSEAIAESDEMTRIELLIKENRDSGVDVGKIKRFSNSLLDINDQYCCRSRSNSVLSLDSGMSGMSVSFHSDEIQQLQQIQNNNNNLHHAPVHQKQGSSCSNSSGSSQNSHK